MTVEELLREAQYEFNRVSFGDTRDNRKHRARATSLAKKIIRKSPTSAEASQANDLLIRLGSEHYVGGFSKQPTLSHTHSSPQPNRQKHDHSDLLRSKPSVKSLENYSDKPITWSTLMNSAWGLKANYLIIAFSAIFLFVMVFGFFLPLVAFILLVFVAPFRKKKSPQAQQNANRAKIAVHEWILKNQR